MFVAIQYWRINILLLLFAHDYVCILSFFFYGPLAPEIKYILSDTTDALYVLNVGYSHCCAVSVVGAVCFLRPVRYSDQCRRHHISVIRHSKCCFLAEFGSHAYN